MEENKEVQKKPEHDSIASMITRLKPQLEKALPKHVTTDRLARVALTAIRNNAKLQQCDAMTLMGGIMTAGQLGLELNTPLGHAYLIPYQNKGKMEAQFQMGYQGIIDLAYRSREYKVINAFAVDEADKFDYTYGLEPTLNHVPAKKPTGNKVYYYAVFKLVNGGTDFRVWSKEQVMHHAEHYSKSWDKSKKEFRYGSAWKDSFDSMAKKTVLIDLMKYAPKSIELGEAVNSDNMTLRIHEEDPDLTIDGSFEEV